MLWAECVLKHNKWPNAILLQIEINCNIPGACKHRFHTALSREFLLTHLVSKPVYRRTTQTICNPIPSLPRLISSRLRNLFLSEKIACIGWVWKFKAKLSIVRGCPVITSDEKPSLEVQRCSAVESTKIGSSISMRWRFINEDEEKWFLHG